MKKLKKWNWTAFFAILFIALMGALSNKTIPDTKIALLIGSGIGVPMGLLFAFISREP